MFLKNFFMIIHKPPNYYIKKNIRKNMDTKQEKCGKIERILVLIMQIKKLKYE